MKDRPTTLPAQPGPLSANLGSMIVWLTGRMDGTHAIALNAIESDALCRCLEAAIRDAAQLETTPIVASGPVRKRRMH